MQGGKQTRRRLPALHGEAIFRARGYLLLEDSKNDQGGASQDTSRNRSLISTKKGIDSKTLVGDKIILFW